MPFTSTKAHRAVRLSCVAYVGLIALLSLLPSGTGWLRGWDASVTPNLQNLLHLPAYAVLLLLAWGCLPRPKAAGAASLLAVAATCVAYGVALEFAQTIVPGRTGSLSDVMLNAGGVGIALTLLLAWRWLMPAGKVEAGCEA